MIVRKPKRKPRPKCPHGRQKSQCRDCDGVGICEHKRIRSTCRDCHGGARCEHNKQRWGCWICSPSKTYRIYERGAIRRGFVFEITLDRFIHLLHSPCHYCGLNPSGGVDRRDNALGYTFENSVPCCTVDNRNKLTQSEDEYLAQIVKVYEYRYRANKP